MEFAAFAIFVAYLVPWLVAVAREHERHAAILALTLLLGWTVVGWFAALAWALRQADPVLTRGSRNAELSLFEGGRVFDAGAREASHGMRARGRDANSLRIAVVPPPPDAGEQRG